MSSLYDKLWKLGEKTGCHQMKERSFFICGKQFPICARCFGAFIGYISGGIIYPFYKIQVITAVFFCTCLFIDWFVQKINILQSTNFRRLITGILCGFSLMQIYIKLILCLVNYTLTILGGG